MKFMVVDDSEIIRMKIGQVLQGEDFNVVGTANNGIEAVKQFQEFMPVALTLDITMPLMDGIETIKRLIEINPEVRILVVSALADKVTLIHAMKLGASGFLCKPFTDNQLADSVHELIEGLI